MKNMSTCSINHFRSHVEILCTSDVAASLFKSASNDSVTNLWWNSGIHLVEGSQDLQLSGIETCLSTNFLPFLVHAVHGAHEHGCASHSVHHPRLVLLLERSQGRSTRYEWAGSCGLNCDRGVSTRPLHTRNIPPPSSFSWPCEPTTGARWPSSGSRRAVPC